MEALDLEQVNAFILKKHHLTDGAVSEDILEVVRDIGRLHATLSTTPYISLFLRTKNFYREDLDETLYKKRLLGKVRYARKTVYMLPEENVTTAHAAMKSLLSGNATYSVLIDRRIEGVWDWTDHKDSTIKYFLFKEHNSDIIDVLCSKAIKMGRFLFDEEPKIIECDSMAPLNKRTMGGFMSPLKNNKSREKK